MKMSPEYIISGQTVPTFGIFYRPSEVGLKKHVWMYVDALMLHRPETDCLHEHCPTERMVRSFEMPPALLK